jgi:hypothetical protein
MRKAGQLLQALGISGLVGGAAAGGYSLGSNANAYPSIPEMSPEQQAMQELVARQHIYEMLQS